MPQASSFGALSSCQTFGLNQQLVPNPARPTIPESPDFAPTLGQRPVTN